MIGSIIPALIALSLSRRPEIIEIEDDKPVALTPEQKASYKVRGIDSWPKPDYKVRGMETWPGTTTRSTPVPINRNASHDATLLALLESTSLPLEMYRRQSDGPTAIFCRGLAHAYMTALEFNTAGVHAIVIAPHMPDSVRTEITRRLVDARRPAIIFAALELAESMSARGAGFETVIMAAPISSRARFLRTLAIAGNRATIIDLVQNWQRLSTGNDIGDRRVYQPATKF